MDAGSQRNLGLPLPTRYQGKAVVDWDLRNPGGFGETPSLENAVVAGAQEAVHKVARQAVRLEGRAPLRCVK